MSSTNLRRILMLGTALVALAPAAHAQVAADAQAAGGTTAAAPGPDGPTQAGSNTPDVVDKAAAPAADALQEIVVTANKTTSSVQRTPIALRVVSGADLRQSGVTDVAALTRLAPDLGITTDTIYTKLSLRGVTAESIAEGADAALSVNIDGEYINRPVALNASFFDLDRIEVLKGPQGTLYGRNSTAGAINIVTAKPTDKFEGYVTGGYGNFNAYNVQAAVNVPLTDTVAFRIAGIHTQHRGYRDLDVDGGSGGRADNGNTDGARATIAYQGDRLHAFVQGEYINVRQSAPAQFGVPVTTATPGVVALPTVGGGTDYLPINTTFGDLPRHGFPTDVRGFFKSTQYHVRGTVDYALTDRLHVSYVGGYLDSRNDSYIPLTGALNYLDFVSDHPHEDSKDWSNELRVSYKGDRGLFLQAGAFYFHEKQDVQQSIQILNAGFAPPGTDVTYVNNFFRPDIKLNSLGLFGQGDLPITDTLKVTGGIRYSRDKKRAVFYDAGFGFVNPALGLTLPTIQDIVNTVGGTPSKCQSLVANGDQILNQCYGPKGEINWLGGVEWQVRPTNLLYAKVSTGYRSGGFDNLTSQVINGQQVGTFNPEHITAYEIGAKNRFARNKIELNVSGFYYDYKNLQIDNFINTSVGAATVNAGKARFYGVDTDLLVAITPRDRFTLTANYLNAKYTKYDGFATGINSGTPEIDLSGNRPPQAPKITVAVGYDHSFDLGDKGTLRASVYSRIKSSYYLSSYNFAGERQSGYSQTDLSLTWTSPNQQFSIQGFAHNLENYVPITYASFTGGSPTNLYNYIFGAPRTYGVTGTVKF